MKFGKFVGNSYTHIYLPIFVHLS